jgi:methyl-accepting chemotaxis protein
MPIATLFKVSSKPTPAEAAIAASASTPAMGPGDGQATPELIEELRASLPALPVLAQQLKEVTRQIETAVVQVCENFQAMAARARQAAQVSLIASGTEDVKAQAGGIGGLIAGTRETMADLLRRIEQTSQFSSFTVDRMETMEQQIGGLQNTLREIDEVASNARVLALNGQLEAARAGEHGKAFSVVATETAKMAIHAVESSRTIRERIEDVATTIGSAASELRDRATADTQEAARSRQQVNTALDRMVTLHEDMQQAIAESRRNSDQLAREIAGAVMAMQFQDSVSQRIQHVVQTLEELHGALQSQLGDAGPGANDGHNWATRMAQSYTMDSERRVLADQATAEPSPGADLGDNVELF